MSLSGFKPTLSSRVAPDWGLRRALYRLFLHSHSLFPLCLPIDGVARIFSTFWNPRSCHLSCQVPSFTHHLRPEREKNRLNIATRQCQWRESNPGHQHSKWQRCPLHHCLLAALPTYLQPHLVISTEWVKKESEQWWCHWTFDSIEPFSIRPHRVNQSTLIKMMAMIGENSWSAALKT